MVLGIICAFCAIFRSPSTRTLRPTGADAGSHPRCWASRGRGQCTGTGPVDSSSVDGVQDSALWTNTLRERPRRNHTHHTPHTTHHTPHTTHHTPHTTHTTPTYHIPHTTYHIPHTTYHIPHTTYHIPHTTYHIPHTTPHHTTPHTCRVLAVSVVVCPSKHDTGRA